MLKFYILRSIRVMLSYLTSFNSMVASEGGDFDILYLPINPYLQDLCPGNRPWFITDACKKRQGDLETQELGFPFCILLWFLKWKGLVFLIHFTYSSWQLMFTSYTFWDKVGKGEENPCSWPHTWWGWVSLPFPLKTHIHQAKALKIFFEL